jgi:hypothetical protein
MHKDRVELISTIILSIATILVAWSAFQSGKWSGVQAIAFSEAGAARVESTRADTLAGQQTQIDITLFTEWIAAIRNELDQGIEVIDGDGGFVEIDGTLSTFLFRRMRDEFRPALDAWLAADPVNRVDAPPSPFAMPEYEVAAAVEADRLLAEAEAKSQEARDANQISDTYVLTAVLFAMVLFFGGVSSKLERRASRTIALVLSVLFLLLAVLTLASLPIELGDEFFFLG